jgi:glycosyltransferase involved in cell wall biosynthesis
LHESACPMADVSVVICTHNPRRDYLRRVLGALDGQTLEKDKWELLVVDNASNERLATAYDLSWHPRARHVREANVGLTLARFCGITEARGDLLIFVDDDNVLSPDFLETASAIYDEFPHLGAFGAGSLEPEFEVQPPAEIRPRLSVLALRSVSSAQWSNNARDHESIPWGAGLCVRRPVADVYQQFIERLGLTAVLGRRGTELCAGDDDVFSWVAATVGYGFGIFPQLRATHLITAKRLNRRYVTDAIRGRAFSNGALHYMLAGTQPHRIDWTRYVHLLFHGLKNGQFSMQCQWAQSRGEDHAARFIAERPEGRWSRSVNPLRLYTHVSRRRTPIERPRVFYDLGTWPAGNQNFESRKVGL